MSSSLCIGLSPGQLPTLGRSTNPRSVNLRARCDPLFCASHVRPELAAGQREPLHVGETRSCFDELSTNGFRAFLGSPFVGSPSVYRIPALRHVPALHYRVNRFSNSHRGNRSGRPTRTRSAVDLDPLRPCVRAGSRQANAHAVPIEDTASGRARANCLPSLRICPPILFIQRLV